MLKTLAVMTSGGDSPGMNAAIRAVVRRALDRGLKVYGVYYGYEGLLKGGDQIRPLRWRDVGGVLQKGGTFLGTARCEQFRTAEGRRRAAENIVRLGIEALVVIGGDGSLMGAHTLATEWPDHVRRILEEHPELKTGAAPLELKVVGLPGSIDNDLVGTDMSIGADSALNHVVKALDDLSSTAASHQRTFVVETMGRNCGYLALAGALAGGASWVLIPEQEFDPRWRQKMVEAIQKAREFGRPHQLVVLAEGARHSDGLFIDSQQVSQILSDQLGIEVRVTVLGHVQRGGAPTAYDRILATRLGAAAVDMLIDSPGEADRRMIGILRNKVAATPLIEVVENSSAAKKELENANYGAVLALRGPAFKTSLDLVKLLTRITPAVERRNNGKVVILTSGPDAPGMNAAVSVAARCLINHGAPVFGAIDGFQGLINDNLTELDWNELVGWVGRPGSDIGTARFNLGEGDLDQIARTIRTNDIEGLIIIGGWGTYLKTGSIVANRDRFKEFNIPIMLIPATIDGNLPCTEFCVGSDTALNNIVDAVDKIRHTAGTTRRTFIVEVMGRQCGFLALMGALATGSEKAYLPEIGISLADLNRDVGVLKDAFAAGKRMVIFMRNEDASLHYTTDFIRRLLEEESKDEFEVRAAILGHLQRGGAPTAFDRIVACRMGAAAAFRLIEALEKGEDEVMAFGLGDYGVFPCTIEEAFRQMDLEHGRPKQEWFLSLLDIADTLGKCGPSAKPFFEPAEAR